VTERRLVLYGDPILRKVAEPVDHIDDEVRGLIEDMFRIMYEEQGIGLAAPQVGESRRIFIIDIPGERGEDTIRLTLINPRVLERKGRQREEEGCLSIPGVREDVDRAEKVVVRYHDVDGTENEIEAWDLLARVIQHENDHIDGILFIDRIPSLRRALLKRHLDEIAAGKVPRGSERASR
jgi:peptide deformylase